MRDKDRNETAAPDEQRRQQFAPHESPKRQPDGDPGPNSAREGAVQQRGTEGPERVEHDTDQN